MSLKIDTENENISGSCTKLSISDNDNIRNSSNNAQSLSMAINAVEKHPIEIHLPLEMVYDQETQFLPSPCRYIQ